MSDFVTLQRGDPNFRTYLLGDVGADQWALPVQALRLNSQDKITFQVANKSTFTRPSYFKILTRLFRTELLSLTLGPALIIYLPALLSQTVGISDFLFAITSLFFLHAAAFSRNDYVDHLSGIDQVNEKGGSRVIQKGWITARSVRNIFYICTIIAAVLGGPILWKTPTLLLIAFFLLSLGIVAHLQLRWGSKVWVFGDTAIWLCLGPLMTTGAMLATGQVIWLESILMGAALGILAVAHFEARHMISMVVDQAAGLKTMPTFFGFDRARVVMALFILVATGLISFALFQVDHKGVLLIPLVISSALMAWQILKLRSPLASTLYRLPAMLVRLHLLYLLTLFVWTMI